MRTKFILTLIITTVLSMGTVMSQITPAVRSAVLTESERTLVDQRLSRYSTFTMDKTELVETLNSRERSGQVRIRVNENLDWTIDLELNDLRAPGYRSTYTTDEGTFESTESFVVNTYKGTTSDGRTVRFTIDENTFFGVVLGDNDHYVIRSAGAGL